MGHQRLGRLPAHRMLPEIVRYLVTGGTPTGDLVQQITEVGQDALRRALKDPVFIRALWLLVRIPQAAASTEFVGDLEEIDMSVSALPTLADILVAYDASLEELQRNSHAKAADLGEIARQAGLAAIAKTVQGRLPVLWDPKPEDVRASLSAARAPERFGALAHEFFGNFVERIIHYFIDRNLHRMLGPERIARSLNDLQGFNEAIRRHCDESALIMRAFAKDWLGKNHYKLRKQITEDAVRGFAGHAIEKIRIELDQRKGTS
jgi:hypothetical protein